MVMYIEDVFGEPRYFKNLPIYPIKIKDSLKFEKYMRTLNIPKNTINDPLIIRMSYLRFLLTMPSIDESFQSIYDDFLELLKMVFRTSNIKFYQNDDGTRIFIVVDDEFEIRESEFDKIKKIICEQNLIELDNDEYLNAEFRQKLLEAKEFKARKNKNVAPLDQRIILFKCLSGESYDEIKEKTIYQFNNELRRYHHIKMSDALQFALYGGSKEFKDDSKIPEWFDKLVDKEDDLVMDAQTFTSKIQKDLGSNK